MSYNFPQLVYINTVITRTDISYFRQHTAQHKNYKHTKAISHLTDPSLRLISDTQKTYLSDTHLHNQRTAIGHLCCVVF